MIGGDRKNGERKSGSQHEGLKKVDRHVGPRNERPRWRADKAAVRHLSFFLISRYTLAPSVIRQLVHLSTSPGCSTSSGLHKSIGGEFCLSLLCFGW